MKKKNKLHFNLKTISILFTILFLLSLVPILAISVYNHPCADDYSYGTQPHLTYLESGNIINTLESAVDTSEGIYKGWQGTFSATFIMSLQPAVFSEKMYSLTTLLMLFMLIAPTLFLLHTIVVKIFKSDRRYALIIGVFMLFFSIQYLPSLVQGFFWFNGSCYYTFFYGIMLFLLTIGLRVYCVDPMQVKKVYFIIYGLIGMLASFIIGGGNYVTALTTLILLFVITAFSFVFKKPLYVKVSLILFFITVLTALLISAMAPGNAVRQANFEQYGIIHTVMDSFRIALQDIEKWFDLKILSALLLLAPVFFAVTKKINFSFRFPLIVLILSFCVFAAQNAPPIYAMNNGGDGRLRDIVYYFFVWLVVINSLYFAGWLQKLLHAHAIELDKIPLKRWLGAAAILFFVFLGTSLLSIKTASSYICARDFVNGTAKQYSSEINQRYQILYEKEIKQPVLKPISVKPEALFFDDITTDTADWRNVAMARYFQKESVILDNNATQ